jgi:glycosyltransferase involved in cell wall biosynthesis
MNRTNVLLLIYKLEIAGAERVVTDLARGLNRDRFNTVVCSFKGGPLADEIRGAGIKVYVLNKSGRFDLMFPGRLLNIIKQERVNIIHAHTFSPNFWGCLLGRLCGVPVIITTEHNICSVKKIWQLYVDRILAGFSNKIVAVSEQVRQSHIKQEKINPAKIITIYNGIDKADKRKTLDDSEVLQKQKELGLRPHIPTVIKVARLHPQKGHKYLLEAIKLITDVQPEIQFLIVGDGSLRKELEELSKRLRVDRYVVFTGFRSEIFDLLQIADIAVWSSVQEGFPITLLEAMAAGKPVIVTDVGGNSEAVKSGITGFIIPPKNPQALAESVLRVINDRKLLTEMGENARKHFLQNFTVDRMVDNTEELYISQLSLS